MAVCSENWTAVSPSTAPSPEEVGSPGICTAPVPTLRTAPYWFWAAFTALSPHPPHTALSTTIVCVFRFLCIFKISLLWATCLGSLSPNCQLLGFFVSSGYSSCTPTGFEWSFPNYFSQSPVIFSTQFCFLF